MAFTVADAEVRLGLNDRGLLGGLRKAEREVQATTKRLDGMRAEVEIDADLKDLKAKEKEALEIVRNLKRQRAEVKMEGDKSNLDRKIAEAEAEIKALSSQKVEIKMEMSNRRSIERDLIKTRQHIQGLGDDAEKGNFIFGRWLKTLSNVTVRVGPFTASIRTLIAAIGTLGPAIISLVGAAGALVSVLGTGLVGAASVGAGAFLGFAQAGLGVGLILKPLIGQFGAAMKASKAYNQAVLQYGKDSKQAATAQAKLNSVLDGVDSRTRRAFKSVGQMRTEWQRLTASAKPEFFKTIGEGITSAHALLPSFARNSTQAFKIVAEGARGMLRDLRSPGQAGALSGIFGNFNRFLQPALGGLRSMQAVLLRIGQIGSSALPGMGRSFQEWAANLERVSKTGGFQTRIQGFIEDFRQLGHFAMAAGRLIKTVFLGGESAGRGFLQSMTAAMNRWTAFLNTTKGQKGLKDFFSGSVDTTRQLFAAIAPLGAAFLRIMTALRPVSNAVLAAATAFSKLIGWITQLPGAKAIITGLGAVIAVGFVIGPVLRFAGAIRTVIVALSALRAAAAAGSLAGMAAALTRGGVAAATTGTAMRGLTLFTGEAAGAAGFGGLAAAAAPAAAAVATVAAGATALGFIFDALSNKTTHQSFKALNLADSFQQADKAYGQTRGSAKALTFQISDLGNTYAQSVLSEKQARDQVKQTKEGTDEHRMAILQLNQATRDRQKLGAEMFAANRKENVQTSENIGAAHRRLDALKALRSEFGKGGQQVFGARIAAAMKQVEMANNRATVATVNQGRAWKGLLPFVGAAEQSVGRFARTFGRAKGATKLVLSADDTQAAGKVAGLSNKVKDLGGKKSVVSILANSKSAEQAIARLERQAERLRAKHVIMRIDADTAGAAAKAGQIGVALDHVGDKRPKPKVALQDRASRPASAITRAIGGIPLHRSVSVSANVGQALGAIGSVISRLAAIPGSKGIAIHASIGMALAGIGRAAERAKHKHHHKRAAGGPTPARDQYAFDRALASGPPQTHRGRTVNRPTLLTGEENRKEYVIATNPAYKQRNQRFVQMAAADLGGVAAFAVGGIPGTQFPAPKGSGLVKLPSFGKISKSGKTKTRGVTGSLRSIESLSGFGSKLDDQKRGIDRAEALFTQTAAGYDNEIAKPAYTTKDGDLTPDGVARRQDQLNKLADQKDRIAEMYDNLAKIVRTVQAYINASITTLQRAVKKMPGTLGKGKHKRPNKRREQLQTLLNDYLGARGSMADELTSATDGAISARNEEDDLLNQASGVHGAAAPEPDLTTPGELAVGAADAALAQAELTPGTTDDVAALNAIISANQTRMAEAYAVLNNPASTNAAKLAAYGDITSTSGAIKGAQEQLGTMGTGGPTTADLSAYGGARADLFKTFGSNAVGTFGAYAQSSVPSATGAYAGADAGMIPAGRVVYVTNNFQGPPPDPHSWSQGINWELQAAS